MPLVGHQRTEHQKAHTVAMRERRWLPKALLEANEIDPTDHRLLSRMQKKHEREMEKRKKLEYNARKREQRVQEKLNKSQAQMQEETEVAEERYKGQLEEWKEERKGLKKDLARLNARNRREPLRIEHAVRNAIRHGSGPGTAQLVIRYVKGRRGVVQDWARDTILMLVNEGIPMSRTWVVMKANAKMLGVKIVGRWSSRTSRRVVREGGIAAGLMIVEYVLTCIAMTWSGDGTTHKSIQYSSRHAVAIPESGGPPKDCFLGIVPEVNHATATQFEGWKETIEHLCHNFNASPLGNKEPANPTRVWEKLRGYLSDHASDQKKLSATLQKYRCECDRELRGRTENFSDEGAEERREVMIEKGRELMEEIGGPDRYLALPIDEQILFAKRLVREAQICLGERAYQQLSPEEKEIVDWWVWSGCAMHKDLNAMKGGAEKMSSWWVEFGGGMAPVALMNKSKAVAANAGLVLEETVVGRRDRGGEKLTGLLGSLVKHRETKKGHQERFRAFSIEFLGVPRPVQFPDTSNNRYQSHGLAATEILHHLDLYLAFLQSVADSKSLGNELNHLESNVQAGLVDPPTQTELAVMSLYSQVISLPFAQRIRTPSDIPLNGLDLGPDYDRVKRHMEDVIKNPDLLLGHGVSHEVGTLYGEKWDNEDVIHFIRTNLDSFPHLQEVLITFFQGALETWEEFTKDVCGDPKVVGATPEQRRIAFRHPANDLNEGALGTLRQEYRAYPNITFSMVNAKLMCRLNPGVVDYTSNLSPDTRCYLRGAAREQDQNKSYQHFLLSQAHEDAKTAKEKRTAADRRKKRVQDRMDKLEAFEPILSLKRLKDMTVDGDRADRIKEQLSWHKRIGGDVNIPAGFHAFRKTKAWVAMIKAVQRHQHGVAHRKLKEPEEINENVNPFTGVEITSDMEGSDGDRSDVVESDNDRDVLTDCIVDSECEDIDLEDEGTTPENEDTDPADEDANPENEDDDPADEDTNPMDEDTDPMDKDADPADEGTDLENEDTDPVDEGDYTKELNRGLAIKLNVVPPWPTRSIGDILPPPYTAGCVWTEEDWSCSYDAVFMVFWSLYEQSPPRWRNDWAQSAPEWNIPLGNNFNHLTILAGTPISIQDRAKWFSCYRDRFRDQLSRKDPRSFPRRGPFPASASRILEITFGRTAGPYLIQHLACRSCGTTSQAECEFCFLTITGRRDDESPVLLHTIWSEFVRRSETNTARSRAMCPHCQAPNQVEDLSMPDVPWIWFERDRSSSVLPSLTLTFDSPPQQLNYSLRAIIYAGGNHFTVRFRDKSGNWWRHDGRVASGVPQPDDVQSEVDLLMNGARFACTLIYRRDDY